MQTLKRGKFAADAARLDIIISAQGVGGLVVGLPLNMDGSDGPSAQSARAFARNWAARSPLPVLMQDERLSTSAVTRTLLEADASRRRRSEVVDKMAAAYILQGALDRLRNLSMTQDTDPARILKYFHPPVPIDLRTERIFLLVGAAAFFAGYDINLFGLATKQIQASLHIPENQLGPTLAYFRTAAFFALAAGGQRRPGGTAAAAAFHHLRPGDLHPADRVRRRLLAICRRAVFHPHLRLCRRDVAVCGGRRGNRRQGARAGPMAPSSLFILPGAGLAAGFFAAVNILPYGWRALYVIGSVPIFLVALLRRRLPETKRFRVPGRNGPQGGRHRWTCCSDMARQYPVRIVTVVIAAAAFGFAISPATFLAQKYLQEDYHYTPGEVSLVLIPGGLFGLGLTILAGRLSDRLGRKPMAIAIVALSGISFLLFFGHTPAWAAPLCGS